MTDALLPEDSFTRAKLLAQAIALSLPQKVDAAGLTLQSRLPFKATSVRETLIHRVSALASPAVALLEAGNLVAAIVLTRAVLETVAVVFSLRREVDAFLENGKVERLDDFLMACLVGSRWPDAETQARSVLTMIDHLDKQFEGYRATFDSLCEYAHPNWSGVLGSFGSIDRENHVLHLTQRGRDSIRAIGATSLAMSLNLFQHEYDDMIPSLQALNTYFEVRY